MNKEKKGLLHLIAGLFVLYHGFDSFEIGDLKAASSYMSLAILFMLVAAMHKSIIRRFLLADTAFFLLEATTILYSGWHYKITNHNIISIIFFVAGIAFLILSMASVNDADKPRKTHRRRKRRTKSQPTTENKVDATDTRSASSIH